jgi:hypothetical protein
MAAAEAAGVVTDESQEGTVLTLNSVDAFTQRQRLRRNEKVACELRRWWNAALASARVARPDAKTLLFDDYLMVRATRPPPHRAGHTRCGLNAPLQHALAQVYRLLFADLLEDEYDEEDADEAARDDWQSDCAGGSEMDAEQARPRASTAAHLLHRCSPRLRPIRHVCWNSS